MFAKVKSQVFIDNLVMELTHFNYPVLKAVLKDEKGSICGSIETQPAVGQKTVQWNGLNDLPYGVYTLEVSGGEDAMTTRMVKRI